MPRHTDFDRMILLRSEDFALRVPLWSLVCEECRVTAVLQEAVLELV